LDGNALRVGMGVGAGEKKQERRVTLNNFPPEILEQTK
jgi:hypothetical protein